MGCGKRDNQGFHRARYPKGVPKSGCEAFPAEIQALPGRGHTPDLACSRPNAPWVLISLNSPVWTKGARAAAGRAWGKTTTAGWQLSWTKVWWLGAGGRGLPGAVPRAGPPPGWGSACQRAGTQMSTLYRRTMWRKRLPQREGMPRGTSESAQGLALSDHQTWVPATASAHFQILTEQHT